MRYCVRSILTATDGVKEKREYTMTRTLPALLPVLLFASPVFALESIPDRLVVLTFDDSAKSHYTVARPILLKYKFGATFFITEGFDFPTNRRTT